MSYCPQHRWLIDIDRFDVAGAKFFRAEYERTATGQISAYHSGHTWEEVLWGTGHPTSTDVIMRGSAESSGKQCQTDCL
jgi:hypothetical protein